MNSKSKKVAVTLYTNGVRSVIIIMFLYKMSLNFKRGG